MSDVETPEPVSLQCAASSLRAACWSYEQRMAPLGQSAQDRVERRRLEDEQRALADVADWLEMQAARMHIP